MKYTIGYYELDEQMLQKGAYIRSLSKNYLESALINKFYGNDVQDICILIQLIRVEQKFERLFKIHKPKYIEHQEFFNELNNCRWEWNKRFMIEIRFDNVVYDSFLKADEKESNSILARETLKALEQLDKLPKRLKDFDKEAFKRDVKALYASYGWI